LDWRPGIPKFRSAVREQCWHGLVNKQSERAAWRQFQPHLDKVNEAAKKLPPTIGVTLAEFVVAWATERGGEFERQRREGDRIASPGAHHSEVGQSVFA